MLEKLFTSKNRVKLLQFFIVELKSGGTREISSKAKIPVSAVSGELKKLLGAGIIKKERNVYSLNEKSNILPELRGLLLKTDSLAYPLKKALNEGKIEFAFVFGSFASGKYCPESDVDLMIIGETSLEKVYNLLRPVEKEVGRDINPVVWTRGALTSKKNTGFVRDVFSKIIIMLKGDENELRKIVK